MGTSIAARTITQTIIGTIGLTECNNEPSQGENETQQPTVFSGDSGESGVSGESGDSGESGESGESVESGDSGESGYSGDSGELTNWKISMINNRNKQTNSYSQRISPVLLGF